MANENKPGQGQKSGMGNPNADKQKDITRKGGQGMPDQNVPNPGLPSDMDKKAGDSGGGDRE
jgi:hypothetical protein